MITTPSLEAYGAVAMRPADSYTTLPSVLPMVARLSCAICEAAETVLSIFGMTCQNAWLPTAAIVGVSNSLVDPSSSFCTPETLPPSELRRAENTRHTPSRMSASVHTTPCDVHRAS